MQKLHKLHGKLLLKEQIGKRVPSPSSAKQRERAHLKGCNTFGEIKCIVIGIIENITQWLSVSLWLLEEKSLKTFTSMPDLSTLSPCTQAGAQCEGIGMMHTPLEGSWNSYFPWKLDVPTRISENFESKCSLVLACMAELSVSMYLGPGKHKVIRRSCNDVSRIYRASTGRFLTSLLRFWQLGWHLWQTKF